MADDLPVPRHKGGRPRTIVEATPVTAWVERKDYDRLYQLAKRRDETISAVVRAVLTRGLRRS